MLRSPQGIVRPLARSTAKVKFQVQIQIWRGKLKEIKSRYGRPNAALVDSDGDSIGEIT